MMAIPTSTVLSHSAAQEQVYTNYRLLLPEQEILGTVVVRGGEIADIQPGTVTTGQNGEGAYLMPGLVELHTDNLERCVSPRPRVCFPLEAAAAYHDRDLVSAGITTVCDAIAIGDVNPDSLRLTHFAPLIDVILQGQQSGRFAADHHIHLRCELGYDQVYSVLEEYIHHPQIALISLMDHTPGQRQFVCLNKYRELYTGKYGVKTDQIETLIQSWQQEQQQYAAINRQRIVALAQAEGIALASHDDTTVEHIHESVQSGVAIAEFPTTLEAAKEAHRNGLQVLIGAPNVVLGGSQSGNVSALELINQKTADIISSDYAPRSLLHAIFVIASLMNYPLHQVVQWVTLNSAKVIKLDGDRGSLAIGKRADFITVHQDGTMPHLMSVICQGDRVA